MYVSSGGGHLSALLEALTDLLPVRLLFEHYRTERLYVDNIAYANSDVKIMGKSRVKEWFV